MAAHTQRPYLKDPKQFSYWKKAPAPFGQGSEVLNYASPLARELWYYLRSMGHVKHQPGWQHRDHHGEDGYLLHLVLRGEMWHEINQRRFVVRSGQATLVDLSKHVTYGVE